MDDKQKYKVINLLELGHSPKDIAENLNVSVSTVYTIKRDLSEAKMNGTISQLVDAEKLLLEQVGEELSLRPEDVAKVTKGVSGLEVLAEELQRTALQMNVRIRSLLLSVEHPSELETYANILCNLQTSFVNKNMTQVNIQNNIGSGDAPKYSKFLGDKPGA